MSIGSYCGGQEVSRCCTRDETEESITCKWKNQPILLNLGQMSPDVWNTLYFLEYLLIINKIVDLLKI